MCSMMMQYCNLGVHCIIVQYLEIPLKLEEQLLVKQTSSAHIVEE